MKSEFIARRPMKSCMTDKKTSQLENLTKIYCRKKMLEKRSYDRPKKNFTSTCCRKSKTISFSLRRWEI